MRLIVYYFEFYNLIANGDNNGQTGGGGGVESLVTQVARPDPHNNTPKQDDINKEIQKYAPKSGGFCSCFTNLFGCCSKPTVGFSDDSSDENGISMSPTKDDKPDSELLDNTQIKVTKNNTTTRENSTSESLTEYDGNLLPPLSGDKIGKKCLVLDLDETLVHSSFKPIPKPDFIIPVEIDHVVHHVYVLKRPYVDLFLEICAKHYEIVIFTASLSKVKIILFKIYYINI